MDEHEQPYLTDKQLRKLRRFLLPGNPMRQAAKALLACDYASLDQPHIYLKVLDSPIGPGFDSRLIAAEALRFTQLTPELGERIEDTLRAITSYRHIHPISDFFARTFNVAWRYVIYFALLVLTIMVAGYCAADPHADFSEVLAVVASAVGLILFFGIPVYSITKDATRYRRLRSVCTLGLGRWGGPASVGTLIGMSEEGDLWAPARAALRRVLMRLTKEDYGRVSAAGVLGLSRSFSQPLYPDELDEWVPLLLNSLEKVGTGASVEGVQVLAKRGRKKEWQEHAQRVLPTLLDRPAS
jgi:hypothetical protein